MRPPYKAEPLSIWRRLYTDFLMRSRLPIYERLLLSARERDYEALSISTFAHMMQAGTAKPDGRYLILRHDVDTDVRTARTLWQMEYRHGCRSSFFFRLTTLSARLMQEMHSAGFEASYHYEEISTIAKLEGLRTRNQILSKMPVIRNVFLANLQYLRNITGLPMRCVAAHGDFVNRLIRVPNTAILEDLDFRRRADIEFEAYDAALWPDGIERCVDVPSSGFWQSADPFSAIYRNVPFICVLTHPRHWHAAALSNLTDDLVRAWEGTVYRVKTALNSNSIMP